MAESKKYQIAASAVPQFIADQSDPANESYVFAYTITIENVGTVPAQLISRHWIITDWLRAQNRLDRRCQRRAVGLNFRSRIGPKSRFAKWR